MNLISFVDELVKVSAMRVLTKYAREVDSTSSVNSVEPPSSIMGGGSVPMALRVVVCALAGAALTMAGCVGPNGG